jgi:hypothetical protein
MHKIKALSEKIFQLSTIKVMIVSIIIFILFMALILPAASAHSQKISGSSASPDTSLIYSADDIYDMADAYGEQGRRSYVNMRFSFDLVWPIVYLLFMTTVLANLLKCFDSDSKMRCFVLIPLFGAIFDYLENIFAAITIARFPSKTPVIAQLTPVFTMIKWALLGVGFTLILALLIYRIYRRIKE